MNQNVIAFTSEAENGFVQLESHVAAKKVQAALLTVDGSLPTTRVLRFHLPCKLS